MTLIANMFGGPGCGKTTVGARLFSHLKELGISAEYAPEYARELILEGRLEEVKCQPKVFGEQLWRIQRAIDKVDIVVTDSPIVLSRFYYEGPAQEQFENYVEDHFLSFAEKNISFLLKPVGKRGHSMVGRRHNEEESAEKHKEIEDYLKMIKYHFPFKFDYYDIIYMYNDTGRAIECMTKILLEKLDLTR